MYFTAASDSPHPHVLFLNLSHLCIWMTPESLVVSLVLLEKSMSLFDQSLIATLELEMNQSLLVRISLV